jgi:hypothetical protein
MIFATRRLTIVKSNRRQAVEITIYQPVERAGSWYCRFDVGWPFEPATGETGGADGVQALFNALQMIGIQLYTSQYHARGQLIWDAPGNGYGFPVPKGSRDWLVGSDKRFFG